MSIFGKPIFLEPNPPGSIPSNDPTTMGAGFVQQTQQGVRQTDPYDDRVTYVASDYGSLVPQAVSRLQRNDYPDAAGYTADGPEPWLTRAFLQSPNPTHTGNTPPRTQVDAVEQNQGNGGSFSEDQWRPNAGFPLGGTTDRGLPAETGFIEGSSVDVEWPNLVRLDVMQIPERARGYPERYSGHPSQDQPPRPWDVLMGTWPWSGRKSAQNRPLSAQPFNDADSIHGALPSPTGAGGPVYMINDLDVHPMTFRTAPTPWDTGTDGTYVDSGV